MTSQGSPKVHTFLGMPAVLVSEPMLAVLERVKKVAPSSVTVLIQGESGSGKEVVARALHHYSLRSEKSWIDISCAVLPEHLVESELFGFEKGAFSGAAALKRGLFELADGGTLFLDEIGELDARLQVKLLRVLDCGSYYRLGGVKKVAVDVRIIAATNQNLAELVETGRFRKDLYHRLAQFSIKVPPLRERVEDILPIAELFLEQIRPEGRFAPETKRILERFPWPGNVRQLRNVVMSCAVMSSGEEIRPQDLPPEILEVVPQGWGAGTDAGHWAAGANGNGGGKNGAGLSLENMERQLIRNALDRTGGQYKKAAELLGISVKTLSRRLKEYDLGAAPADLCVQ